MFLQRNGSELDQDIGVRGYWFAVRSFELAPQVHEVGGIHERHERDRRGGRPALQHARGDGFSCCCRRNNAGGLRWCDSPYVALADATVAATPTQWRDIDLQTRREPPGARGDGGAPDLWRAGDIHYLLGLLRWFNVPRRSAHAPGSFRRWR